MDRHLWYAYLSAQRSKLEGFSMERATIYKVGIVILKVVASLVAYIVAVNMSEMITKAVTNSDYISISLSYVFLIGMVAPIWYRAPMLWRFLAATSSIVAGLAIWMLPSMNLLSDIFQNSQFIGAIQSGSSVVSLIICISVLHSGRLRM
jgi:hypothetical protein